MSAGDCWTNIGTKAKRVIRCLEMETNPTDGWSCNGCPYLAEGMAHCLHACMTEGIEALKVLEDLLTRIHAGQLVDRQKLVDQLILESAGAGSGRGRGDPFERALKAVQNAPAKPEK